MAGQEKIVSVFGSGVAERNEKEYRFALEVGRSLAQEGYSVCCGGYGGIMEAVSRGAAESGGTTIGVTLKHAGRANQWITQEIPTASLFERLERLFVPSSAYVVMNGGTGTLVEVALAWELMNKRAFHTLRPVIVAHTCWVPVIEALGNLQGITVSDNPHFPCPAPEYFYYADNVEEIMSLIRTKS